MSLMSLILAAMLMAVGGITPPDTTDARTHIVDLGAQSSGKTPPESADAGANVIDVGDH